MSQLVFACLWFYLEIEGNKRAFFFFFLKCVFPLIPFKKLFMKGEVKKEIWGRRGLANHQGR